MKWLWRILAALALLLVAAFYLFRVPDTDPAEMRAKYGASPSQFVELAPGHVVHLRDEGPRDAPVIVMLHGSGGDLHTWGPWAEDLQRDHRVVRFDQIAHGLTGPAADGDYSVAAFADDVTLVADHLALDRFVLVGHSMGGRVAATYALQHADRLDGLVLVGASGAPVEQQGSGNLAYTIVGVPGVRQLARHITPRSMIERSFHQSVSNQDIVTPDQVDRYWELLRYPGNRAAALERLGVPRANFTAEQIAGLDVPTLLIWGEDDTLVPFAVGQWYAEHLPQSSLVSYPDIGHLPHEEAADRSVNDLRTWLVSDALSTQDTE